MFLCKILSTSLLLSSVLHSGSTDQTVDFLESLIADNFQGFIHVPEIEIEKLIRYEEMYYKHIIYKHNKNNAQRYYPNEGNCVKNDFLKKFSKALKSYKYQLENEINAGTSIPREVYEVFGNLIPFLLEKELKRTKQVQNEQEFDTREAMETNAANGYLNIKAPNDPVINDKGYQNRRKRSIGSEHNKTSSSNLNKNDLIVSQRWEDEHKDQDDESDYEVPNHSEQNKTSPSNLNRNDLIVTQRWKDEHKDQDEESDDEMPNLIPIITDVFNSATGATDHLYDRLVDDLSYVRRILTPF